MDMNTTDFVAKFNEDKYKQRLNKQRQGTGHPDKKLPSKRK